MCTSTTPTPTDWDNINVALGSGAIQAAHVVADLAAGWKDKQTWCKAFMAGKGDSNVAAFGVDRVYRAFDLFGFPAMLPTYVYTNDAKALRLTLVSAG